MTKVPEVVLKTRVRDESVEGENPFRWQDVNTKDLFSGKRAIVFALPGAFTPTCSSFQLPGYEAYYEEFKSLGIDEVYCLSVNDAFVMFQWAQSLGIENVKMLPDGNAEFTAAMDMAVSKSNLGFGVRSWRYAMVIDDGEIEKIFEEEGKEDDCPTDPYDASNPETVLDYLYSL